MKNYALLFLCLFLASCHAKESLEAADSVAREGVATESAPVQSPSVPQDLTAGYMPAKAKLIRTADYRFKVSSVKKTTETIEAALLKYPAYTSGSTLTMLNGVVENNMTIRVQAEYFYALMKDIDALAEETDRREIVTQDVGKEYVDLESRLKTKREVEARYMNILRKNTGTIEEILAAEQQIGAIHEEIEATISRLNYLKEQVGFSTIKLEFYEPFTPTVATEDPLYQKFGAAFMSGFRGAINFLIVLTNLWPLSIVAIITWYFIRNRRRKVAAS
jgi:hypothetical protein